MKNNRQRQDHPTLYGTHAVQAAWLNPNRQIHTLYMTEQAKSGFEAIMLKGKSQGLRRQPPIMVDKKKLEKMLPSGAVHQGLALSASGLEGFSAQDFIIQAHEKERSIILMLDQITDPHNVGAILRSACAFGASGVFMQKRHAPDLNNVLAKTACGAIEHVPVACVTNLSRTLEEMQEGGFLTCGLDERGKKDIEALAQDGAANKIVLVLGAEGGGIRPLVKEHCDMLVRLPMHGPMPSINVSNAAAVALYALSQA